MTIHLGLPLPTASCRVPGSLGETPLTDPYFTLLRTGFTVTACVTARAVRSYRTLSALPDMSGGFLSVALSLGSLRAGVTRRPVSVEPGLSSTLARRSHPTLW